MKCIGRYQILGLLGRGGMSQVYKVVLPATGRTKALKILSPRDEILIHVLGWDELIRLFAKEARLMATLRHENIAAVEDFDEHDGRPFFTMEYHSHNLGLVLGETYRVEDDSRRLSVEFAVHYTRQILLGLDRLHDAGNVHRDIKPFNVLLTEEDQVKIIDFGLSRLRGEQEKRIGGLKIGSPYYAAPEQEEHPDVVDGRADLYGVGIMLIRMLTGRLFAREEGREFRPSELNPDLDLAWDDFLLQAVARDPRDRFASAEDMLGGLMKRFTAWQNKVEATCRLAPEVVSLPRPMAMNLSIRHEPRKISLSQAQIQFGLDGLWRPKHYSEPKFMALGPDVVLDAATHLLWHSRGSRFPMTWLDVNSYFVRLNENQPAGRSDWRLPTVNELITILTPPARQEDLCLASLFDPGLRWVWSADRSTFTSAWIVDARLGYIGRLDFDGLARVCAVCSPHIERKEPA